MRVERIGPDKIRVFLTFDDLMERGIEKEDMWRDIPRVHELFNDMMEQAYEELGFEVTGPVAVEVFTLPAQGMVVVVTRGRSTEQESDSALYELEVTLEESDHLVMAFDDLEALIQAAHAVHLLDSPDTRVYSYEGSYYLVLDNEAGTTGFDNLVAVLSEFGQTTAVTEAYLTEYAKVVFHADGLSQLRRYFPR